MAKATQKITMNPSENIPFDKLVLSQKNVRRIKNGVTIEELAADIAHRRLLESLNVRPMLDEKGEETGMFEVPAGGRRFLAIELLVKQKKFAKTDTVPCVVNRSDTTSAEEDSLAENFHRERLLGHVAQVSFNEGSETSPCLLQAARSAYPKSWRRAAWNRHFRDVDGVGAGTLRFNTNVMWTEYLLAARLGAPHISPRGRNCPLERYCGL